MAATAHVIRRCQHIKVNGEQCGSPALTRNRFCYFHNRWRAQEMDFAGAKPLQRIATITFPVLEDANSIQVALMQIMQLLLTQEIDPKVAGLLLYGLQTASANLRQATLNPRPEKVVIQPGKVRSTKIGENAWIPPVPPVEEMSPEERDKLVAAVMEGARNGEIDGMQAIKMWAQISGWDKDPNILRDMKQYEGPPESETPDSLFEALAGG